MSSEGKTLGTWPVKGGAASGEGVRCLVELSGLGVLEIASKEVKGQWHH